MLGWILVLEPVLQARISRNGLLSPNRHCQRLLLTDEDHQLLPARHARINEVALEHHIVLHCDWQYHDRIFAPLGLVNGRGIAEHKLVQLSVGVNNFMPVEVNC